MLDTINKYLTITNSDLTKPCFAWHPYGKLGLFKTELVIIQVLEIIKVSVIK